MQHKQRNTGNQPPATLGDLAPIEDVEQAEQLAQLMFEGASWIGESTWLLSPDYEPSWDNDDRIFSLADVGFDLAQRWAALRSTNPDLEELYNRQADQYRELGRALVDFRFECEEGNCCPNGNCEEILPTARRDWFLYRAEIARLDAVLSTLLRPQLG